jgi:tRNA threonylcarbamoyladenosine biosynthesis protein TsaB
VIIAFSTSSPLASVAAVDSDGKVLASAEEWAPMAASGTCLTLLRALLQRLNATVSDAELFLSDLGPGSFTGVKVGITLAKTLAFSEGKLAGGAQSFDLISADGVAVLPSKRDEWFVRIPGQAPHRQANLPEESFKGYGNGIENPVYPRAENFAALLANIERVKPEHLVPEYLIDPAISTPKKPYATPKA